eukprot:4917129-Prymnesium_polylepis.1
MTGALRAANTLNIRAAKVRIPMTAKRTSRELGRRAQARRSEAVRGVARELRGIRAHRALGKQIRTVLMLGVSRRSGGRGVAGGCLARDARIALWARSPVAPHYTCSTSFSLPMVTRGYASPN